MGLPAGGAPAPAAAVGGIIVGAACPATAAAIPAAPAPPLAAGVGPLGVVLVMEGVEAGGTVVLAGGLADVPAAAGVLVEPVPAAMATVPAPACDAPSDALSLPQPTSRLARHNALIPGFITSLRCMQRYAVLSNLARIEVQKTHRSSKSDRRGIKVWRAKVGAGKLSRSLEANEVAAAIASLRDYTNRTRSSARSTPGRGM